MSAVVCSQCGAAPGGAGGCLKCLLDTGFTGEGQTLAERIFQAALSLEPGARAGFAARAAEGDAALLAEVQMLLEGYAEAGGDGAQATRGGTARERWAALRREEPGTVMDHFRLVRIIGEGGMGSVWEAEQTQPIRRRVALKIIKQGMDTEEVVRRFERERRTLARLTHPHIAQVYEAGATPLGRPYFAMELVEGETITAHCAAQLPGVRERVALFLEVCAAVEHAHQRGVIHRDLKPSNILVSGGAVKVIDFGIAKATQDEGDGLLTKQQQVLGTPAYMSPEQAESDGQDVDTRTDVYSLGAVLYELLSGALPHDPQRLSSTGLREMRRILREEQPPVPSRMLHMVRGHEEPKGREGAEAARRPSLPADLDWITMKALGKERDRRYASAAALAEDLRRFLAGEAVSAAPPALAYRFGKFVRRNRAAVAAMAAVVLALAAGLIVSLVQMRRTHEALAGEAKARAEATFTVADLYTRSGLAAAEKGDASRAALWFTNAAIIAADDPARAAASRLRAAAWTQACRVPVHGFETGLPHIEHMAWHPGGKAMIVTVIHGSSAQVWDLETETRSPLAPADVECAAWSGDGTRLFLSRAGRAQVLEYPSGKVLAETAAAARAAAFSPDGARLAVATDPPFVWDWQANARTPAVPLDGGLKRVRWSADGRYVLWQSLGSTGLCAATQPGVLLFPPVPGHSRALADFTADGARFFHSAPAGNQSFIRESATGSVVREIAGGDYALALSADGRYLARAHAPLWPAQNGNQRRHPAHDNNVMEAAQFSPDGTLLATAAYDATARLWSVADDRALGEVGWHQHPLQCVAWSPDGAFLATSQIGLVRVWRVKEEPLLRTVPAGAGSLAAVSADGKFLAASGVTNRNGTLRSTRVFAIATAQPAGPELPTDGIITDAAFAPGNAWLALAVSTTPQRRGHVWKTGGSGYVELRDGQSGARQGEPVALPSEPRALAVHPSGEFLALYGGGGEGVEWERRTGALRPLFPGGKVSEPQHTLNNGRIAYSADGRFVMAWGQLGVFHLYDRHRNRPVAVPPLPLPDSIFHGLATHGGTLALAPIGPAAPQLLLLDAANGHPVAPPLPHSDWLYHAQFDDTGTLLLTSGRRPVAQVWDWQRGALTGPALPHSSEVMAGVFVPGTPWVITGAHDGMIRFWDRRTGMMIRPPIPRPGLVLQLTLTPDARHLIAAGFLGSGELDIIDLHRALPAAPRESDPECERLRAELNASAWIHEGGGLVPLTGEAWLEKWRELRRRGPDLLSTAPQLPGPAPFPALSWQGWFQRTGKPRNLSSDSARRLAQLALAAHAANARPEDPPAIPAPSPAPYLVIQAASTDGSAAVECWQMTRQAGPGARIRIRRAGPWTTSTVDGSAWQQLLDAWGAPEFSPDE